MPFAYYDRLSRRERGLQEPLHLYVSSFMGAMMVVGIVHKNGILMLDSEQHFSAQGHALREAIFRAGRRRLRPILMTALATIVGMLPLALDSAVSSSSYGNRLPGSAGLMLHLLGYSMPRFGQCRRTNLMLIGGQAGRNISRAQQESDLPVSPAHHSGGSHEPHRPEICCLHSSGGGDRHPARCTPRPWR